MVIEPTVGRIVWYRPTDAEKFRYGNSEPQPYAAQIAYVWGDRMVNLSITGMQGDVFKKTSVPLVQEGDYISIPSGYCEWMPYQKGQAAKASEVEAEAAA